MKFKTWMPFLISILFKESSLTPSNLVDEYNIAKDLNDTIVGIFQRVEPRNVAELIVKLTNLNEGNNYTYNTDNVNTSFYHVQVIEVISNDTRIHYDFLRNEMKIRSTRFIINVTGFVSLGDSILWYFKSGMNFRNITLKVSKKDHSVPICTPYNDTLNIELFGNASTDSKVSKLARNFLPAVLIDNINNNQRFLQFFEETYNILTKKRIISKHADFSVHENRYYHLIPNVTFTSYVLKNIIIEGLSNFHSLHNTENPLTYILIMKNIRGRFDLESGLVISMLRFAISTLSIYVEQKNNTVRIEAQNYSVADSRTNITFDGLHSAVIMELIEATIAQSIMPSMKFQRTMKPRPGSDLQQTKLTKSKFQSTTTHLANENTPPYTSITKLQPTTKPRYGSSTRLPAFAPLTNKSTVSTVTTSSATKLQTTTKLGSGAISHLIESTTQRIVTTTRLQTKPTDDTTKHLPNTPTITNAAIKSPETRTGDLLNYHLLFNDVNIKLIWRNQSNPENFECDLHNNLKFTHKINAALLESENNQVNTIPINFYANISSINISVIRLNNTKENDSCQFQIHINQIIDVKPSHSNNTTIQSNIQRRIKKKIDAMLKGARKDRDRIIRMIKPTICSTLNVCSQSVKITKDAFLRYVDAILKKCSLRGTSTTPQN